MLKLNDGRSELWQWDTNRKLTVDVECSQVHFSNKVFGRSIDVDVVDGVASIPDILLQTDKELTAWAFVGTAENGYTKISKVFKVNKRNKPADYVFTPTEQTTLGELIERLDKIEESQDPDAIKNAVDDYLANNTIEIDETDPTVPEWAKQPTKPSYTASEVGALPADTVIPTIPDNVSAFRNDAGYLTEHQDLTGYATERYVQGYAQPKGEYLTAVPDGYATEQFVSDGYQPKGNYLTEHQSLEGYATEEFVKNKIAEAELGGEEVDLSGYAQKSELPTKVSQLENDEGFITDYTETDPTVPAWAKSSTKPSYTKSEVGLGNVDNVKQYSASNPPPYPVTSVNGKTGTVNLDASAVGARPSTWMPSASDVGALPVSTTIPTKVSQLTNDKGYLTSADKAEIVEDVLDAMDGIPSYWQTALDDGVEAINNALCEAGRNKSAFLFYTDAHWNYGSQMSPTLLKYLYKHTGMTRTFFGGDIVNNEADDYDTMAYLWEWRKQLKDLPNHHSVVGNHDDGNTTNNLFSEQYVYGYLLSAEESSDMVMGEGIYYYVDSPAEKTRYLCLDTAYKGVDSKQQEFVKDALLTTPGGWHIVAISHIWHDTNYNTTPPTVGEINSSASTLLSMFEAYNSRNGDYADCTGWVEFCIGGHTHWDYDSTSTLGIPIILVETDSQHTRSGLTFTAGTTTEASVNGIIADYDAKTVKVVRIGRGASREVEMTWYEVSYTNVITTATDTDGVTIYNGIGYKENTRMSGSSGSFKDNTGSDCTGYIKTPVGEAFTVYMKNVTANTADNYGFKAHFFNSTGVAESASVAYGNDLNNYNAVYDDDGNVIQFTATANVAHGYMVISAVNIDGTSIITINEPID